jgi:hypothetical protein
MAISAAAKSHHDQLFGDRVSALAQSDPELIEYFGNFAFDEVHADAARLDETLDLHTRLMVQLAAIHHLTQQRSASWPRPPVTHPVPGTCAPAGSRRPADTGRRRTRRRHRRKAPA